MERFKRLSLHKATNSTISTKVSLLSSSTHVSFSTPLSTLTTQRRNASTFPSSSSWQSSHLFLPMIMSRRHIHPTLVHHSPADVSQALADEIKRIIQHDKLVLFLTGTPEAPQCKFTSSLIDLMDQLEVEYGYFDIAADDEMCEAIKAYSDWPTFPQVYLDGELIGGYDICKEMMFDGSLTRLLKEKGLL